MSRLILSLAASILVLSQIVDFTSACKCLPPPSPGYCRTDFLALVRIKAESENLTESNRIYGFDLITDLTPQRTDNKKSLAGLQLMTSPLRKAHCGVMLEVGETYLLGGGWHHKTGEPFLFWCRTFAEKWKWDGERSQERLNGVLQECAAIDKKQKEMEKEREKEMENASKLN